ncbi:MAG: HD domain-containing protein [Chitinophagales bacterium]|nr:CCA tRNA nucleotidyltransferase [Chitinophagales bacterium]MDW8392753.1 HD domain-containing protein [Chitinophagales bacterium]
MQRFVTIRTCYKPLPVSDTEQQLYEVVAAEAAARQAPVYVVGGHVRDKLLQRDSKDIDFTVVGNGLALAEAVGQKLQTPVTVFKNFGTARLQYHDFAVEFVGARRESYRPASRKPEVQAGTLLDDLARRDFTINALAVSLNADDYGMLLDAFDGLGDLERRLLRTPLEPELTFSDDPLRMLRAVRFAAQLDFAVVPEARMAMRQHAERLRIVSIERITDELNKMLMTDRPSIAFDLMFKTDLLREVLPELVLLYGVEHVEGKGHKDNFYHTLQVLDQVAKRSDDLWLRWAALLHDIAKYDTKRFEKGKGWTFHGHEVVGARKVETIFRRLHLPLQEPMKRVQKLVLLHLRPIALSKEEVTDSAIRRLLFEAGDDLEALMTLCESDITSKNEKKVKKYLENFRLVRSKLIEVEERDRIRNWQPPISGEVIMRTFAKPPGREIGIIKEAIREAILEGRIRNTYDDAYAFMLEKAAELGWHPVTKN